MKRCYLSCLCLCVGPERKCACCIGARVFKVIEYRSLPARKPHSTGKNLWEIGLQRIATTSVIGALAGSSCSVALR